MHVKKIIKNEGRVQKKESNLNVRISIAEKDVPVGTVLNLQEQKNNNNPGAAW